jgi:two-component system sensor histidine kinase/response regulator
LADRKEILTHAHYVPLAGVCMLLLVLVFIAYNVSFHTSAKVHGIGQLFAGMFALFYGVLVLRDESRVRDNALTIAAVGFIGSGIFDICHGVATFPRSQHVLLSELIAWGWLPSRVFLAAMLCVSLLVGLYEKRGGGSGLHLFTVGVTAIFSLVACILVFWILPVPLPQAYYPESAIPRPAELLPAGLFLAAFLGYFFKGNWRKDRFEYYLLLALAMFTASHTVFMPHAQANFDSFFMAGMLSKIFGYLFLITGLILQSRLQLQQEAEAQRVRHQAIVNVAVDAIITFDVTGKIESFNPAAEKMYGYSAREKIGSDVKSLAAPSFQRAHARDLEKVLKKRDVPADSIHYAGLGQHKNGSIFPEESATSSIEVNGETLFISIIRDISDGKAKEDKLIEVKQRLALALESAGLGIWQLDLETRELRWDPQMYVLYGRDPADGIPSSDDWVEMTHLDDREACLSASRNASENNVPIDLEVRIILPDSAIRWLKLKGRRVEGNNVGRPNTLMGMSHDITDQKQHQQELEAARTEADEANRAKSAFLATMSHEIRTPLNGVIGMTEVLQQSNLQEHQSDMAGLIRQSAFSLLGIIEDVLDFSKIEAGKLEIDSTPVELEELAGDVCAIQVIQATKNDVDLCLFVDPQIPKNLLGDGQRTRQILTNLVSNAIKFSSNQNIQGRVSLRISATSVGRHQAVIECSVTDNGIGMDEATMQRLFRPFSQGDASTSRNFGGTGLGLTISQSLAKLMGGEIVAQSEHGEGSTFTARLPFTILPFSQAQVEAQTDLSGITCLTIGGTESIMPDLGVYLAHAGATVEHVPNLDSILELTSDDQNDPRVWVIDIGLNQFSEEELRHTLERHPRAVVLTRDDRLHVQLEATGVVAVDGNILRRITLLRAVEVAAGLSGAKASSESVANEDDFAPPSRREALMQNRLILVAEDNETNQKVIQHQLTRLGYCAEIANHGEEALRQWRTGEYALLLTDLQMPEMDGYQLAQAIRAEEDPPVRIPIVALTANTLSGEAEHSIAVGMDDYLSKPASLASVGAVLAKWLPAAEEPVAEARDPRQASSGVSESVIDLTVLESSVGAGSNVIDSVLEVFPAEAASIGEELRRAFTSGQARTLEKAAHKLRSSAVTVGARALGELCTSIEVASLARSGPLPAEQKAALLAQLETELAAIDKFIEKRLLEQL